MRSAVSRVPKASPTIPAALGRRRSSGGRRFAGVLVACAALVPCQVDAQVVGPPSGSLVIVGGALSDPDIVQRFIALAGGPDAPIVVVPTAGGGEYDEYCSCLNQLRENGARNLVVLHTYDPAIANTQAFAAPLTNARGVWFMGGRQWRLVDAYTNTRTEAGFQSVLDRGGVIGGSSAGASIQGELLIRGDTRTSEVMLGDHLEGFGYMRNTGIDQHLLARNRQFDMLEVMKAYPDLLGIGLDENTAVIVRGDRMEVMGRGYVAIYDNGAQIDTGGDFYFLRAGDLFDLANRTPSRGATTYRPLARIQRGGGEHR